MNCAEVAELTDLYVVDALPAEQAEDVETHLATCSACQDDVDHAWEVAKLLRVAVPGIEPPSSLRTRIMHLAATEEPTLLRPWAVAPRTRSRPLWSRFPARSHDFRWAATAAVIPFAVSALMGLEIVALQREVSATRSEVESASLALTRSRQSAELATEVMGRVIVMGGAMATVQGTELAPTATGMIYYVPSSQDAILVADGLPRLYGGDVYQLWFVVGEKRMSGGTFNACEDGRCLVVAKAPMPLSSVDTIRVTTEPRGGSDVPHGNGYLWARLKAT
ncbi:MAG: putative transrane anti-sigma factor [Chloroflexi bacterium]|nr:putative transrane anti-sigma factor [Chloroflexota bacterium]